MNNQPETPKKKKGCLYYGLIALAVLVVVGKFGSFLDDDEPQQADTPFYDAANTAVENTSGNFEKEQFNGYKEGQYKIGVDMPAGQYMLIANEKYSAYFALTTDANGKDIICNDNFDNNSMVEVYDGEFLEIKRCYAVPLDTVDGVTAENGYLPEGMYIVGKHIAPGEYKVESTEKYSGYYCIYSDLRHDDIVANNNFDGSCYVELTDGQYFLLSRAKIHIGE